MYEEYYQLGLEKLKAKDSQGALAEFTRAIQFNPQCGDAYYQRALLRFKANDQVGAIADYHQAILFKPTAAAYLGRGLAQLQTGDAKAALADAQQASQLDPKLAAAQNLLATAHRKLGDSGAAIAAYKTAAQLYIDGKDRASGERCLTNIQQLKNLQRIQDPVAFPPAAGTPLSTPESEAFLQQAMKKVTQLNYQSALEDFNWLIQTEPHNAMAYCYRGIVRAKLGKSKDAIADLSRAMSLKPQNVEFLLHRSMVRIEIGDAQGALQDLGNFLADHPDLAAPYIQQGHAYCKLNNHPLGIESYSRAIELDPHNAEVFCSRAEAKQAMGNQTAALEDYQQACQVLLEQGNWPDYERILQTVKNLQNKLLQAPPPPEPPSRGYHGRPQPQSTTLSDLRDQLHRLVGGNWALAERLLGLSQEKYPDMPEDWHLRKVIYGLENDRR